MKKKWKCNWCLEEGEGEWVDYCPCCGQASTLWVWEEEGLTCEICGHPASGLFSIGGEMKLLCWKCESETKAKEGKKSLYDLLTGGAK